MKDDSVIPMLLSGKCFGSVDVFRVQEFSDTGLRGFPAKSLYSFMTAGFSWLRRIFERTSSL
jgi:hypothetical protein